jgi:hypothetical protein
MRCQTEYCATWNTLDSHHRSVGFFRSSRKHRIGVTHYVHKSQAKNIDSSPSLKRPRLARGLVNYGYAGAPAARKPPAPGLCRISRGLIICPCGVRSGSNKDKSIPVLQLVNAQRTFVFVHRSPSRSSTCSPCHLHSADHASYQCLPLLDSQSHVSNAVVSSYRRQLFTGTCPPREGSKPSGISGIFHYAVRVD